MVGWHHRLNGVWANSGRYWRTGKPGMLQSMGLPRVGYDLATEQQHRNHIAISLSAQNKDLCSLSPFNNSSSLSTVELESDVRMCCCPLLSFPARCPFHMEMAHRPSFAHRSSHSLISVLRRLFLQALPQLFPLPVCLCSASASWCWFSH